MLPFLNMTVRSADDLFADLRACRQLRHVCDGELRAIVKIVFGQRQFVWMHEAFAAAFHARGYGCDTCGVVVDMAPEKLRAAADRALENMDGRVKPMLCRECANRCSLFCRRFFDREVNVPYSNDLEAMFLAFIAYEVLRLARKVQRQALAA